ncbi:MAG TPA: amidase [Candidatus Dormibacteraeota bacterium]|nr:amidase [Candidatus Dormibacteraeota bacterium]
MHETAWLSAVEIAERVRSGQLDSQAVVAEHLERISRLDGRVGAFVHVDRAATAGAAGPLAGVALAVKDTQPVAGMPWTYGSRKWRDRVAGEDAIPVARARAAGAAVLGKTNTPELAASVSTVNELFPPTQNPWRVGYTPGGSSGGSAAAVAAGLATIAFGDDMGGSIRIPASCCGVAGLRPTPDLVPTEVPSPIRLSCRGPLARTVADLRLALAVMTGQDAPSPRAEPAGLRVAVVRDSPLPTDPACAAARERAAAALEVAGHSVRTAAWDPMPVARSYQVVRPASVAAMPGQPADYGAEAGALIAQGREQSVREYLEAFTAGLTAARHLHRLLDDHDAILTPTLGRVPMPVAEVPPFLGEAWCGYTQYVLPVSFAGLPAVSVPAGANGGLPVGIQLVGRPLGERALLDLAEQLESAPGFGFQPPSGWE